MYKIEDFPIKEIKFIKIKSRLYKICHNIYYTPNNKVFNIVIESFISDGVRSLDMKTGSNYLKVHERKGISEDCLMQNIREIDNYKKIGKKMIVQLNK